MAVDVVHIVAAAVIAAIAGTIGYFGRRRISREGDREKVTLYNSYATLAATLKAQGLTMDDVEGMKILLNAKERQGKVQEAAKAFEPDLPMSPQWTQTAMNVRAAGAADVADAQLRVAISDLRVLLDEDQSSCFEEAQEAWENYRDKQAHFAASPVAGGSMEPLMRSLEWENLTTQRITDLRTIAKSFDSEL